MCVTCCICSHGSITFPPAVLPLRCSGFCILELLARTHCCVSHGNAINGSANPREPSCALISSLGCHTQCVKVWSRLKLVSIPLSLLRTLAHVLSICSGRKTRNSPEKWGHSLSPDFSRVLMLNVLQITKPDQEFRYFCMYGLFYHCSCFWVIF